MTGEESALVNWIGSGRALPVLRADKSVAPRAGRRPALVHNVETLAHVALIARHGPDWFRRLGTPDAHGSTLVTVTGAVATPGVLEVELGTPVEAILDRCRAATELSAVLLGGYGGTWLDGSLLTTPYAPGPLADAGATGGAGVVVALPAASCGIGETARLVRYLAGESAGQCGPCVHGLPAVADDLERLWRGRPDRAILDRIGQRLSMIEGRGACRHPDGAVRLVRSALTVFAHDAADHARGQPCPGQRASSVLTRPPRRPPQAGWSVMIRGGAASVSWRISVDPVACDAYGYCAELLPERITLDEWGYPIVDGAPVEPELLELARRAVAECPRRALKLEAVQDRGRSRPRGS